jgi:AcrR family transcriptional regulator
VESDGDAREANEVTGGAADDRQPEAGPRRRGRPTVDKLTDRATPELPIENPIETLPASAQAILAAARHVLRQRGFEGLTIETVANEANVSRTLIPYHFGSRAGLMQVLVDSLFHDLAVDVWRLRETGAEGRGLSSYLELVRREARDLSGQRDFFELMVLALRDKELSRRVAQLFSAYREIDLDMAGIGADSGSPWRRPAIGAVLQSIADGLALQAVLDPDFDLEAAVDAVGELLGPALGGAAPAQPPAASPVGQRPRAKRA